MAKMKFVLAIAILGLGVGIAHADPIVGMGGGDPTFFFDENGNGHFLDNAGNSFPFPGVLAPDPSNGGAQALTFFGIVAAWGSTVNNGDVGVLHPDGSISDAIRFTDANGNLTGSTADRMIFYSDVGDGDRDLADTGFPQNLFHGAVGGPVTEAADGSFNYGNVYLGQSDGENPIPEPASLTLLGLGIAGIVGYRAHRRKLAA
jgi:hypothetical protein